MFLHILVATIAILCGVFAFKLSCNTSLKDIPKAHWSVSISPIWILWIRFQQMENATVQAVHMKKGPIVRLGPNEISINSVDAGLRTVYGSFEKHRWYRSFWNLGKPNMFSFENFQLHSERRRVLSRVYSKTNLFRSPLLRSQNQHILYARLKNVLDEHAEHGQPLEMVATMLAVTMDVVTAFLFGLPNSSNLIEDLEQRQVRLAQYQCRSPYAFFEQELQSIWKLLEKLSLVVVPKHVRVATASFEHWVVTMCEGAVRKSSHQQEPENSAQSDTVVELLHQSMDQERSSNKAEDWNREVASEMTDHIIAGHETSGIALAYLIYELSRSPNLQARLHKEVKALFGGEAAEDKLPCFSAIDQLPFLHACTLEILRAYPPIVGPQARVTPPDGCILGGFVIPGGVRVSARASCLHRNPSVYPSPSEFRPERWLDSKRCITKVSEAPELYHYWWAFGSGGRGCLGNHFAMHDIKVVAVFLYSLFETIVVDHGDLNQTEGYIGAPQGGRLLIKLKRRNEIH
ncbi:cytochrome P450 [Ophiobolus disseminans]|uniref:Cytochrome P450 n=1 Tax=Ophiobolus disseminans TaxID=1469910 RepID=A0A6A6ZHQ1_9PLEO|nr:cytochrome P450 [Ophiobolus disseminans]